MNYTLSKESWLPDAISIDDLCLKIGSILLFKDTKIKITKGVKVGILGRNGCGKTTLFNWFDKQGQKSALSIYQVKQELPPTSQTILQIVLAAHIERGTLWERQIELEAKEELTDEELEEYTQIGEKLSSLNAENDPPKVKKILKGLGFSQEEFDNPLTSFSGGWRARVALAQGLFMEPDILMLDEPTNHLDLEAVVWLIEYLRLWKKTLIFISHNIGFVREVATQIWNIQEQKINIYSCIYDRFYKQIQIEEKKREEDWLSLQKQIDILKKKGKKAEIKSLLEKKEKEGVKRPDKPYVPKFFFLSNSDSSKDSSSLLSCTNVYLGYNNKSVLKGVSFSLFPGSKVAIVGGNGSGKTTFLKYITDELEPLPNGEEWSENKRNGLRICRFEQHFYHLLPENKTPIEFINHKDARKLLGASGLEGDCHTKQIQFLSGGQKARVYFSYLSSMEPDILVLDEPTNHLDIETIEGLVVGLKNFTGSLIIVSHDVHFLEEVVTEVWQTENERLIKLGEGTDGLDIYIQKVVDKLEI